MKSLLFLVLAFSFTCFAGSGVKISDIKAGKMKYYVKGCDDCVPFPEGAQISTIDIVDEMEDDVTKPIYEAKSNVVACAAVADNPATTGINETKTQKEDCLAKELVQVCDSLNRYFAVRAGDNSEVYCTRLLGYGQKLSGRKTIVENASKKSTYVADKAAKDAKKAAIAMAKKAIECGKQVIAMLAVQNASKGLSTTQIKAMNASYMAIKDLLETGSLTSAREEIIAATVDGVLVTKTDKTVLVAELDSCKP